MSRAMTDPADVVREPFRLLVCGGRDFRDERMLFEALDRVHAKRQITPLIHGAARGADTLAGEWAKARGVEVLPFPVLDWRRTNGSLDKSAGPRRNRRMFAEGKPDGAVAFAPGPKGDDSGTADMARVCIDGGIKVWFVGWPPELETPKYGT